MGMTNIHAYTENHLDYPAFVSINQADDGKLILTARARGDGGRNVVSVELTSQQLEALAVDALAFLNRE